MVNLSEGNLLIQSQATSWIQLLAALLTPLVAIGGLYLAYRSNRLSKHKLQFDLFEKRYSVFMTGVNYYRVLTSTTGFTEEEARSAFIAKSLEARFLFTETIGEQMLKFHNGPAIRLKAARAEVQDPPAHRTSLQVFENQTQASNEVESAWYTLAEAMKPFLRLSSE